jgi:hypothetical protein
MASMAAIKKGDRADDRERTPAHLHLIQAAS